MPSTRVQAALDNAIFARRYVVEMLATIPLAEWFAMPAGAATHVAWQVGHLAMAEYRMALERARGARADDARLISPEFIALFARQSRPSANPGDYPAPEAIHATLDRVHERALTEVPRLPDSTWDEPLGTTHRICKTKYEALVWWSQHELIHAGHIGLLRRLLGQEPMW